LAPPLREISLTVPYWDSLTIERMGDAMQDIDMQLGRRLRRRRRLMGLSQQALAGACGVGFQQIQKYECAENRMSAARLFQIAEALEVPVSYFFDGLAAQQAASH
jgi:ribosome-binding protein aMBF1 (putative translation factor)